MPCWWKTDSRVERPRAGGEGGRVTVKKSSRIWMTGQLWLLRSIQQRALERKLNIEVRLKVKQVAK